MRVYLAASLFSVFDRERNAQLAEQLRASGLEVFLPQDIGRELQTKRPPAEAIFRACASGIDECDVMLAIVEGADVDSGVAWEMGYAFCRGIPIVSFRTDYRGAEHGATNIMLEFSPQHRVEVREPRVSMTEAIAGLERAIELLRTAGGDGSD